MSNFVFPIIEMFHSIQGEGKYMGHPCFFVRVTGCNLRCVFKNTICDTEYSSFHPEKQKYTFDEAVEEFKKLRKAFPQTKEIVITGGEPMLYQKGMIEFLKQATEEIIELDDNGVRQPIWSPMFSVTVETNGTQTLKTLYDEYFKYIKDITDRRYNEEDTRITFRFDLLSLSPKLSTSEGSCPDKITPEQAERHHRERINYKALADVEKIIFDDLFEDFQLKFVYSGPECIGEIKEIIQKMTEMSGKETERDGTVYDKILYNRILNNRTYLMPEGITFDDMIGAQMDCVKACIENNWNFAPRLHIMIWGNKRGV